MTVADLVDHFQEVVPNAAGKAGMFLNVIRERANSANLGLTFEPKHDRKTKAFTLQARITFKRMLTTGKEQIVVVFAEPTGSLLSVGWQLTQQGDNWLASISENVAYSEMKRDMVNVRPENVRQMNAMLAGFHNTVFMPTLHQLVDATGGAVGPAPESGFLGIQ
jgi:hypothetical protein